MAHDPREIIGSAGWISATELFTHVSRRTVCSWVATGTLVRVGPGVLALPDRATSWRIRIAAALHGRAAVASHVTALALWELIEHPVGPVHLTVERGRNGRGTRGVIVHRAGGVYEDRRRVDGLPVTSIERAVVDTWAIPASKERASIRAAAITAVRRRLTSPRELRLELTRVPRLAGRAELSELVDLLADGCQSELEIWGCLKVLRAPGMPRFVQQRRVVVGSEIFALDAACEESMLAVELDGAAWHGSRRQREADIRRDSLLATVGWQTLRFSFQRLTASPEACRRDIRGVHEARLRLLRGNGEH